MFSKPIHNYYLIDSDNYHFKPWNKISSLKSLIFNDAWNDFFDIIEKKSYFKILENEIFNFNDKVIPYPELIFSSFNMLSPYQIKVIFIGQDPYPGFIIKNNKIIPQAMGLSFSVPLNYDKPKSLDNIYKNLLEYNHIQKIPNTGCLISWTLQGCFMINASFSTTLSTSNAHKSIWKKFTRDLLIYLNSLDNIVFVVWGKDANNLCFNIDPDKHFIITSSHPSPFSAHKTFTGSVYKSNSYTTYPSFLSIDHFGLINKYLESKNKDIINWNLD